MTVHVEPIPALESVGSRLKGDPALMRRGVDFVAYLIADAVVDSFFPLLDDISLQVDPAEDRVRSRTQNVALSDRFRLKGMLVQLRELRSPQRDVFALMAKRGEGWVVQRTAIYCRDVYDHLLRTDQWVEGTRDLLGDALDAFLWTESRRTNEIMKRLTLLSAIFMPLTFVTGFWEQNFEKTGIRFRRTSDCHFGDLRRRYGRHVLLFQTQQMVLGQCGGGSRLIPG